MYSCKAQLSSFFYQSKGDSALFHASFMQGIDSEIYLKNYQINIQIHTYGMVLTSLRRWVPENNLITCSACAISQIGPGPDYHVEVAKNGGQSRAMSRMTPWIAHDQSPFHNVPAGTIEVGSRAGS